MWPCVLRLAHGNMVTTKTWDRICTESTGMVQQNGNQHSKMQKSNEKLVCVVQEEEKVLNKDQQEAQLISLLQRKKAIVHFTAEI